MPNKTSAPGAQQKRLAAYLDSLARAAGHAERSEPLKGYCRGLLLPLKRKSVEPMAACLAPHNVRRTHQSLHHLVADSPWSDQALLVQVGAWTLPLMKKKNPSASRPATNIAARAVCAIPPARGARYGPSGTIRNRSPRCAARSPTTCYTNSTPAFFAATDARGAGQTAVTVTRRAGGTQLRSFIRDGRDAADALAGPQKYLETAADSRRRVQLVAAAEEAARSGDAAQPGNSEKGLRFVLGGSQVAFFGPANAPASAVDAPGQRAIPARLATPHLRSRSHRLKTLGRA